MTEQPPSASKDYTEKARALLWAWGLTDADYVRCYPEVLRFAEWAVKQVAAALLVETERCAMIAGNYGREADRLGKEFACETADEIAARIRAPGERPASAAAAETKTITAAGIVGDWQRKWSINQEQFNAALDDLELEIRRALSAHAVPSPSVVDYTERALTVARDAVEGVPTELWVDRRNSEAIAQAIAPDIAAALSAVASEHEAKIREQRHRAQNAEAESMALRGRLQEPDVRETVARAMCKRRNTKQCAAICLSHSSLVPSGQCPETQIVWGEDADAAIARIVEMLK